MVMTTSTVGRFSTGCMSTGMPRPLSSTRTPPSASRVTRTVSQWPARASSTELSTTSHTMWCKPRSPVEPMYMPGRLRTASSPSRTVMEDALYSFFLAATVLGVSSPVRCDGATAGTLDTPGGCTRLRGGVTTYSTGPLRCRAGKVTPDTLAERLFRTTASPDGPQMVSHCVAQFERPVASVDGGAGDGPQHDTPCTEVSRRC